MDSGKLNLTSLKDKISSKLQNKPKEKPKKTKSKSKKEESAPKSESEDDILRREALALGATEEDLALLKGVKEGDDSEEEFNDEGTTDDKSFNSDLAKFMQGIGLGNGDVEVVEEEEEIPDLVEEKEDDAVVEEKEVESSEDDEQEDKSSEEEDKSSEEEESDEDDQVEEAELNKKEIKKPDSNKVTNLASVDSAKLSIPGRTDWYNVEYDPVQEPEKLDRFGVERLFDRAKEIVEKENKTYLTEFTSNNSQKKFLSQILSDGTLNDKISALTLLIQEAPLHNLKALDTLLGFCEKKSRTAALQAINALKDLLLNGVLPDRKLLTFNKQALRKDLTNTHLALYYFEDYLKKAYFKLISILEVLSHDPVLHVRMNVLNHLFDLIKAKPEQEVNLLRLGVNKLGDIDNKVASKASYLILQLEQAHPAMKKVIVDAVIDIVFQTKSDYHAKYYSILALNQTILTRSEEDLANSLIKTYFALFEKTLVESDSFNKEDKTNNKELGKSEKGRKNNRKNAKKGKKGGISVKPQEKSENEIIDEKNSRLFSALLTGLNRAFPFSNLSNDIYQKHLDTLFKITHSTNFNTSIQSLVLINHIITEQKLNNDRYYRTLYESLLDPRLVNSSKQGIYLNLLFKSLKNDVANIPRVLAFVKRILQICCHWLNVGAIAGMLYLLMELSKTYPQIQELMVEPMARPDIIEGNVEKKENEGEYDSRKRDPSFANADNSSLWELGQFLSHYHPTVSIYASSFLEGKSQPKPDLGLFSLSHFLDRFVYKNSKQAPATKGQSIMQPLGGAHTGSLLVKATNVLNKDVPVNTENWLTKKVEEVKPDEQFFFQYFTTKSDKIRNKNAQKKAKDEDEDEDEEGEGMDDDEVWQALVKSRPEVEDDGEEDDDLEMSDFDEEDFSDLSDGEENDKEQEEQADEDEDEAGEDEGDFDEEEASMFAAKDEDEYDSDEMPGMIGDEADFVQNEQEEESDQDAEEVSTKSKKRSRKQTEDTKSKPKSKKAKLKSLPVFASTEDYAQYLDSEDEDYT